MDHQQAIRTETVDQLLSLLANSHCRSALTYMREESTDVFSVGDIANALGTQADREVDQVTIQLHHAILPKLADASVVNYDAPSKTVQYRGHTELESLLDGLRTANRRMDSEF
ncbi:DUF7344 domain-containing protein [Halorarum salinum]|uniref:DUF7344 domain-containing protein n=1 Tax=Halorarum salinum TaxID=2743089 RepID=A0A7D5LBF4_9EURY|nr:hypothetical protein [Halobaculum salinum]QLG62793.1 hypothetical protein HUG12_14075 [Halobaculum salinum]